jgi:hypothetical protein
MTTDRHKHTPVSFRPSSEGDRAWLYGYAKRTGRAVGKLLDEALSLLRASKEDEAG